MRLRVGHDRIRVTFVHACLQRLEATDFAVVERDNFFTNWMATVRSAGRTVDAWGNVYTPASTTSLAKRISVAFAHRFAKQRVRTFSALGEEQEVRGLEETRIDVQDVSPFLVLLSLHDGHGTLSRSSFRRSYLHCAGFVPSG